MTTAQTAASIHAEIRANVDAYYAGTIDHDTFTARNSAAHAKAGPVRGPVYDALGALLLADLRAPVSA